MSNILEHEKPIDENRAAELLGLAVQTIRSWRCRARGPSYRKVGRRVVYLPSEVLAWRDRDIRRPEGLPASDGEAA